MLPWFLVPIACVAAAGFLLISGLRASIVYWRVALGSVLLIGICVVMGYLSSQHYLLAFVLLLVALCTILAAVITGALAAALLDRWRRLTGILIGLVFPVALFASMSIGVSHLPEAPDPPTVEEEYLEYTHQFLANIQQSPSDIHTDFPYLDECANYLRDSLALNSNQYTLEVLATTDPTRDPTPIGSTDASILVTFADGRQVEVYFYNYTFEQCEIRNGR
jgi:hypothetical protein